MLDEVRPLRNIRVSRCSLRAHRRRPLGETQTPIQINVITEQREADKETA